MSKRRVRRPSPARVGARPYPRKRRARGRGALLRRRERVDPKRAGEAVHHAQLAPEEAHTPEEPQNSRHQAVNKTPTHVESTRLQLFKASRVVFPETTNHAPSCRAGIECPVAALSSDKYMTRKINRPQGQWATLQVQ
eukprot:6207691-Pleurochrysis_carterae.AAC.2